MAEFSYEAASPLVADVPAKRDVLRGAGEQMLAANRELRVRARYPGFKYD